MSDEFIQNLTAGLQGIAKSVTAPKPGRIYAEVQGERLLDAVRKLRDDFGGYHITTITALDSGENFEILYHFAAGPGLVTLRVFIPKNDPTVETLSGIIPGAILYEREIHEIMGIHVKNHPDMRLLLLPENWGGKGYPLRKDWIDPRTKGVK